MCVCVRQIERERTYDAEIVFQSITCTFSEAQMEGDSFIIAFHTPQSAADFCIAAQVRGM